MSSGLYSKVRCGEWDTQTKGEPKPYQDRNVTRIIKHPEYVPKNLQNDFAILVTEEDFELVLQYFPHLKLIYI